MAEPWCEILRIQPPRLESVVGHREATTFALLIVTLLERAAPMTLAEAAERLAQAGAGDRQTLLASLSRCRPARPPIYRDGDRYTLDPYDHDGALWVSRLDRPSSRKSPATLPR